MMRGWFAVAALGVAASWVTGAGAVEKMPWKITKTEWSEQDESEFGAFVKGIGDSGCNNVDQCMKGMGNPFRNQDPPGVSWYSDCADLPYFLRAYFALHKGLPFTYAVEMGKYPDPPYNNPIRGSANGNYVTQRRDLLILREGDFPDGYGFVKGVGAVSSAMFRFPPEEDKARNWVDFYPVRISRDSVKPGTVIYDPDGHVGIVYDVSGDGRISIVDAHPGNSLSHPRYGEAISITRHVGMGQGFKRWRPIRLVGARVAREADGSIYYVGGHYEAARNKEISDYSDEQSYGTDKSRWRPQDWPEFYIDGVRIEGRKERQNGVEVELKRTAFYAYVRLKLARSGFRFNPLQEIAVLTRSLCNDLGYRAQAVQEAIDQGIDRKKHPSQLPRNIYTAPDDEWETYSSPSRDARLKVAFQELYETARSLVERYEAHDPLIDYGGRDLKGDLLAVYRDAARSCAIRYRKSDGSIQALDLEQARERLFALSFDPYHCVELRWGASGEELASCKSSPEKDRWYAAEQRLRNQAERTYGARMDFSVQQLEAKAKGTGWEEAPRTDILSYLIDRPGF